MDASHITLETGFSHLGNAVSYVECSSSVHHPWSTPRVLEASPSDRLVHVVHFDKNSVLPCLVQDTGDLFDVISLRASPDDLCLLLAGMPLCLDTCKVLELRENRHAPPSRPTRVLEALPLSRMRALHSLSYTSLGCNSDAQLLSQLNVTTLTLQGVLINRPLLLRMPQLVDLSLIDCNGSLNVVITNHEAQLKRLHVDLRYDNMFGEDFAGSEDMKRISHLKSLELPFTKYSRDMVTTTSTLCELTFLDVQTINGSLGVSPHLTRIRTRAATGTIVSDALAQFELILTLGCSKQGAEPLLLPASVTAVYLPVDELLAAAPCTELTSLAVYLHVQHLKSEEHLTHLLERVGGLWRHLTRLSLTPSHAMTWGLSEGSDEASERLLAKLLLYNLAPRDCLEHLTIMQRKKSYQNGKTFHAILSILSLRSLILVNMSVTVPQLTLLAQLPLLDRIELISVEGLTAPDCLEVQRGCGRKALRIILLPLLSSFGYGRHKGGLRFA